jgi:hypothetical protein
MPSKLSVSTAAESHIKMSVALSALHAAESSSPTGFVTYRILQVSLLRCGKDILHNFSYLKRTIILPLT